MTLPDWRNNGWLVEHKPTRSEIRDLFAVIDRDLKDSRVSGLSDDCRLNVAYNAALQAATVGLAVSGYRAARDAHHYRVIQSLALTIGMPADLILRFDKLRKKRNVGDYERAGNVSAREAEEMTAFAENLRRGVLDWLAANHPDLVP